MGVKMTLQGFDENYYMTVKLASLQANASTSADWIGKTIADLEAVFSQLGYTAESHYEQYGWSEGLSPNQYFNEAEYIAAKAAALVASDPATYPDVATAQAAFEAACSGTCTCCDLY